MQTFFEIQKTEKAEEHAKYINTLSKKDKAIDSLSKLIPKQKVKK